MSSKRNIYFYRESNGNLLFAVVIGFIAAGMLGAASILLSLVKTEQRAYENLKRASARSTPAPQFGSAPRPSNESIAIAINAFQIRIPAGVKGPVFDPSLSDRGLTTRRGAASPVTVTIGPEAFSSWSLLGSTIAHEVEVHCKQDFFAIHLMDLIGMDGTQSAEREAYAYEIINADRFGLTNYERDLIQSTMTYYYPKSKNPIRQKIKPIQFWYERLTAVELVKRNPFVNNQF